MVFQASMGAPISEVWGPQVQQQARSRQAPGSSQQQQQAGGSRGRAGARRSAAARRPSQPTAADSCDLDRSDPLCDMYSAGFSGALLSAMDQRTDMAATSFRGAPVAPRPRSASAEADGGCGWGPIAAAREPQPALAAYPMQPLDGSIAGMYDFEPGGPVNFYEDDEEEEDEDEDRYSPPPAPAPEQPRPKQNSSSKQPQQQQQQQQNGRIDSNSMSHTDSYNNDNKDKDNSSSSGRNGEGRGSGARDVAPTNQTAVYVDLTLYVVSGVILIFLMEQFIQIGVRLRPV